MHHLNKLLATILFVSFTFLYQASKYINLMKIKAFLKPFSPKAILTPVLQWNHLQGTEIAGRIEIPRRCGCYLLGIRKCRNFVNRPLYPRIKGRLGGRLSKHRTFNSRVRSFSNPGNFSRFLSPIIKVFDSFLWVERFEFLRFCEGEDLTFSYGIVKGYVFVLVFELGVLNVRCQKCNKS